MAFDNRPAAYILCATLLGLSSRAAGQTLSLPLDTIALPPGFSIDLYTSTPLPSARTLVLSDNTTAGNIVYVSTNRLNNVSNSAAVNKHTVLLIELPSRLIEASAVAATRVICAIMQVYAVIDRDADGVADSVVTVISNLPAPLGIAYANGSLWVATTPTIYRFDNVDELALAGRVRLCFIMQFCSTVLAFM